MPRLGRAFESPHPLQIPRTIQQIDEPFGHSRSPRRATAGAMRHFSVTRRAGTGSGCRRDHRQLRCAPESSSPIGRGQSRRSAVRRTWQTKPPCVASAIPRMLSVRWAFFAFGRCGFRDRPDAECRRRHRAGADDYPTSAALAQHARSRRPMMSFGRLRPMKTKARNALFARLPGALGGRLPPACDALDDIAVGVAGKGDDALHPQHVRAEARAVVL